LLLATFAIGSRQPRLRRVALFAVLIIGVLAGFAGCGGGASNGNTGNTTATLVGTASSGNPSSSMTFTVKIQ
jgi:hypothetical protein